MTLTMANMDLKDELARIKKTKLKSLPCPRRAQLDELIKTKYKNQLNCYIILSLSLLSLLPPPPPSPMQGLSHYIAPFRSS